jgi:serine/threonine protein kinase
MSESMSKACPQCGNALPAEAAFCPRDGTRVAGTGSFGELEGTAIRASSSPGASSPALGTPDPDPDTGSGRWEATVARDVMVGKQLGDFVVKRRIGDGGMGIVYEGEHPIIGRKVAIKILRPELTSGAMARDLAAEARAASAIRHRGIIDVFGFGTIPGIGQYLVMEYLEGTPLNEVIARRAPMPETEVLALLDELFAALGAAHAAGVIHRDLKPGNVFVERDSSGAESVKVLDFGLAKRSEVPHGSTPQTRASLIVGTPEYIAPEQAHGQAVGPYTDLYAAGLIAFEMLTRRLPFEGPSPMSIIVQHMQQKPPAPSTFVELHPRLDALVLRLLAKEPSERPASAQDVRRELKSIRRELPQAGTAIGPPPSSPSLPRAESEDSEELASTALRATPGTPLPVPRPRSMPVSGAALPSVKASPGPQAKVTTAVIAKEARPERRKMMGALMVGAVTLAALGGWAIRGHSSRRHAPPPVAQADQQNASATPSPVPPAPKTPPPDSAPKPAPEVPAVAQAPASEEAAAGATSEPKPGEDEGTASNAPRTKRGILKLVVRGTGTIRVDGKTLGEVPPLNTLSLPEGEHKLEVLNPRAYPYKAMITIISGQRLIHRVTLRPIGTKGSTP